MKLPIVLPNPKQNELTAVSNTHNLSLFNQFCEYEQLHLSQAPLNKVAIGLPQSQISGETIDLFKLFRSDESEIYSKIQSHGNVKVNVEQYSKFGSVYNRGNDKIYNQNTSTDFTYNELGQHRRGVLETRFENYVQNMGNYLHSSELSRLNTLFPQVCSGPVIHENLSYNTFARGSKSEEVKDRESIIMDEQRQAKKAMIKEAHQIDLNEDEEWTYTAPKYYNVKETSVNALESYKYITLYKHNKKTNRTVRYFVCQYESCDKKFNKSWNFIDHMRMHNNEKPYTCVH